MPVETLVETTVDTVATDYLLVAEAIRYLEANRLEQPSLEELAQHLAMSPFHLQRLFKRWAGISPKRFLQFLTVEHAKQLLAESHSVLDAALETGLSGPGRLHDLFVNVEAMTPGEFKQGGAGLSIAYGVHATPFGDCLLATTARGVCGLAFLNGGGAPAEIAALHARWPNATIVEDPAGTAPTATQIFTPNQPVTPSASRPVTLLLAGTNFQLKVWEALLRVPMGNVCTYEDLAGNIGQPSAARAVGGAVGANAIAYLIPCHRVIRKSGLIKDYRWGATRKKAILGWEAAQLEGKRAF
jgi:AraC family transcriptional regulator of adaptative response/methylated-DNA-[protein]-cysteine methyltransferase